MTCEVYESRHIKATRKEHTCAYCGMKIVAGSATTYEHGIFDGAPFGRYCCSVCEQYIGGFWEYMDGEAGDINGDFLYYVENEQIPHPKLTTQIICPSCGPIHVNRFDWEHEGWAECPKCAATLENQSSSPLASLEAQKTSSPAGHDLSHQAGENSAAE